MKIKINDTISANLVLPTTEDKPFPFILFLHGFGSDKNEVSNTFNITAGKLAKIGIGSLSIDFTGFGESKGKTEDTTIDNLIKDAHQALDYIMKQDFVDPKRIGICGFSLGAGIGALVINHINNEIKSIAFLSPAGNLTEDFKKYFGTTNYEKIETSASAVEIDLGWRMIKLKNKFIESLKKHFLMKCFDNYKGAFFVIAGDKDFSCEHANKYIKKINSDNKKIIILENNDHIFNANETNSSIELVTNEVTAWFKNSL